MRKITVVYSAVLLATLFFAKNASATTYYVATTGSDSNSGTSAAPFKTIQKAANIVNPGDMVIVRDGVYTDTNGDGFVMILQRAGTPSSWITFKSEHKWGAKIDFTGAYRGFNLDTESAYVRFEDFEIYGGSVISESCDAVAIGSNSETDYAHDLYLYRFKIHDVCRVATGVYTGLSGIDVAGNANGNITIDSCIFYNIGRLNYYTNPQAVPGGTLAQNEATCLDKDGYNACYNRDPGIYTRAGGLLITNNIFYPEFEAGWPIQLYAIRKQVKNTKIVNNTFHGLNPERDYHIILAGEFGEDNILIQNNIFSNPRNNALTYSSTATNITNITVKNNLVYGASLMNSSACSDPDYTCSGNITGDPKFVNLSNKDFHLQSASPAIDKGLLTNAPGKDYDGVSRPQGSAFDIGAYEFKSTTPTISCGDHACNNTETCSTCPADCGTCPPQPQTNPIAYWKMDETGGTTAFDSSGNNLNGTLTNGPLWDLGKINGALTFDGTDDYVQVANNPILNNLTSFTYSAWIYPTGWGESGFGRIISKESAAGLDEAYFLINSTLGNTLEADVLNSSGQRFDSYASANSINLNQWQHVALTYNNSTDRQLHLYINGQEISYQKQSPITGTLKTTANPLIIGNRIAADRTFQGKIDDVRIYNRALTQTEIQSIMNPAPDITPTSYNITNFTQLVTDWLKTISSPADITKDGTVDSRDLGIMMNNWK